ncbi:galactose-1-phosphate uridylyltransferase [Gordonia spumicola]|uniref:Galactose-1-phosphate uridylyltransferase n=1 Tax=Gordonia spumicola TaxID=589161 RepID=A0A7I9VEK7_9ACTN|nr:galactose-1-phosphate uridylyltransferase [Gordonia spumicola]GEE03757.1 galactose-1-phosphate uridylyltransferase [Gordonia spumicola]
MLFDVDGRSVVGTDRRDLTVRTDSASDIRVDRATGDRVIVAPARQERTYLPPRRMCPLCPDPDGRSSEIPADDYRVAVFENRFPSLSGDRGRCEVVCFTSDHDGSFARLSREHARLVLDVLAHRTVTLLDRDDVAEVHCFENRGEEIGVTLAHPHGQIYAYPFVTRRTDAMMRSAAAHRAATGADLFASILDEEVTAGVRVVIATEHTTAFVPYAARWPAEVHVYPNRAVHHLGELTDAEADDLADVYLRILRAYDAMYAAPLPYIASWHQYRSGSVEGRLHAELFSIRRSADKVKFLAGSESARDAFITDRAPEDIAADLRAALR